MAVVKALQGAETYYESEAAMLKDWCDVLGSDNKKDYGQILALDGNAEGGRIIGANTLDNFPSWVKL
ncbi:hypothetical protein PIB30_048337 [Stylosanthes scabra]|uniref:Uncharacterized protein n=1 Tax=Stylosanthes scabra TaxID=79078 RepID=A0ABU6RH18_9FABA|nr:hypothetical protein [Stylosanthes scabra]